MVSTVTISTISIVSSMTLFGALGMIGTIVLFSLLMEKETIVAFRSARIKRLRKSLNVAILPLLVVFLLLATTKVVEMVR